MTQQESNWWLEHMAAKKGISVEEMRQSMRERGAKADKSKSGFAYLKQNDPQKFDKILKKSAKTRAKS